MVVLSKQNVTQIPIPIVTRPFFSSIPIIDLSKTDSKTLLVRAFEEFGFCKVINHGISKEIIDQLESEAVKFFSLSQTEKEKSGSANPFGYGRRAIGPNGDVGWIEYLLFQIHSNSISLRSHPLFKQHEESFCSTMNAYVSVIKKFSCEILELLADGLRIQPRNIFSVLLREEGNDSVFRLNHYPPCLNLQDGNRNTTGFGEHTDPQIISVLRSNNTSGLQIALRDGSWVSVPSDRNSLFVNVGDTLQVLTNGRFKSVRHRVLANGFKSRLSMIYFGGPSPRQKLAPLPLLMEEGEESLYREFTWSDYKNSAYKSRLSDNRLLLFEKKRALVGPTSRIS